MPLSDKQLLQINQAIFSLTQAYYARMAHQEKGMSDLTLPYRAVLMVVGQLQPLNSRQLSQYMNVNPGTISQYVNQLITQGLLEKKQDMKDRRHWWLTLTRDGGTAYQETVKGAVAYTRDFISALSETEKITFHRSMVKIAHSLGFAWQ
jgi:DNA-binding MarR family transcriptional regulator